jgi:hypothetical protein
LHIGLQSLIQQASRAWLSAANVAAFSRSSACFSTQACQRRD